MVCAILSCESTIDGMLKSPKRVIFVPISNPLIRIEIWLQTDRIASIFLEIFGGMYINIKILSLDLKVKQLIPSISQASISDGLRLVLIIIPTPPPLLLSLSDLKIVNSEC